MNEFDALFYLQSAGWSTNMALLIIREVLFDGALTMDRLCAASNYWFVRASEHR